MLVLLSFVLHLLTCTLDVAARTLHCVACRERDGSDRHYTKKYLLPHGILLPDSWRSRWVDHLSMTVQAPCHAALSCLPSSAQTQASDVWKIALLAHVVSPPPASWRCPGFFAGLSSRPSWWSKGGIRPIEVCESSWSPRCYELPRQDREYAPVAHNLWVVKTCARFVRKALSEWQEVLEVIVSIACNARPPIERITTRTGPFPGIIFGMEDAFRYASQTKRKSPWPGAIYAAMNTTRPSLSRREMSRAPSIASSALFT